MKRTLFVTVALILFASSPFARNNPFVGTWKLDPAKSKSTSGALPKEETVTIQMVGDQYQVTGTAPDGSPVKYEFPRRGGTGKILASGAFDGVAGNRINDNTFEISYTKGGKEILHNHSVVSKDGKTDTMTNTIKGTDAQGKPFSRVVVWEKQ